MRSDRGRATSAATGRVLQASRTSLVCEALKPDDVAVCLVGQLPTVPFLRLLATSSGLSARR